MREPFNLRPWEIERLDDFWLAHIYCHPTDKFGSIKIRPKAKPKAVSMKQAYWQEKSRIWGWPDWFIQEQWDKAAAEHKARQTNTKKPHQAKKPKNGRSQSNR